MFHQIWMKLGEVVVWYKCVLKLLQLHKVSLNLTQLTQSNLNNNSILLYTQNDCTTTLACLSVWQQQRNNEHIYFCTDSTRTTRLLASSSPMLYTKPALKRVPGIAGQCMTQLNDLAVPWTQTKNSVCLWCVRFAQGIILEDWYGDGSTTRNRLLMGLFSSRQMKSVGCLYLLWIFVE